MAFELRTCLGRYRKGFGPEPTEWIKDRRPKPEAPAAKAPEPAAVTFRDAASAYIALQEGSWKSGKHGFQWTSTLRTYSFPILGDMPVADVKTMQRANVRISAENRPRPKGLERVLADGVAAKLAFLIIPDCLGV